MMLDDFNKLAYMSAVIGSRVDFVQGGGGNTSVKLADGLMAIKASGVEVKNVTAKSGFSVVRYDRIREYLNNQIVGEKEFTDFIQSQKVSIDGIPDNRPSIETGLHALCNSYTIHTHSVYVNLLTCCKEGPQLIRELFPDALIVEYYSPGMAITGALSKAIKEQPAAVVFMKNHGIIVSGSGVEEVLKLHTDINLKILSYFGLSVDFPQIGITINNKDKKSVTEFNARILRENNWRHSFFRENVLFPDQVIYIGNQQLDIQREYIKYDNLNEKQALAVEETLAAYLYLMTKIKELKLTPIFLKKEDTSYLEVMEGEKYRRGVIGK